jgi:3-oxoacyl-[acyl-carrier protein] reductase
MKVLKTQHGWSDDPAEIERRYSQEIHPQSVPFLGVPRDIGAAAAFLASPLSRYINGALLRIDGGQANFM